MLALRRRASLIFVHGEALREELQRSGGVTVPIEVVPHGVHTPEVAPLPAKPTVLFFGRISHYKGLDVLLDAMPAVWDAMPEARLVVAGDGPLPSHASLEDPRTVLHHRHVHEDEVPGLFADATCVALPYRQASQSGVGSLAKANGRATVVTDTGALPELVADGSGVLIRPEDPAALAAAIGGLLASPEHAKALGDAAALTATNGANWRHVAGQTLEAYRRHGLLR
jgi:glycosyltransferase involved in cell wall biosynthesis